MFFTYSLLFLFGTIVGSFLNVVASRYLPEAGVFNFRAWQGRSHCPICRETLKWYELIPLFSFLIQKGQCNYCGIKISWQYPLVELLTAAIFVLFFNNLLVPGIHRNLWIPETLILGIWLAVGAIFILIFAIDYRLYLIPNELNIGLAILGIIRIGIMDFYNQFGEFSGSFLGNYAALFGLRENIWINHFLAAILGMAVVGLIVLITKGRGMGMGDLKLMAALGVLYGWPDVVFIFAFGSLIGAVASLVLMALGKKNWKSSVPFGPFLVLGAVTVFFFGERLISSYFNLFNFV